MRRRLLILCLLLASTLLAAIALYARRDWRVMPHASFEDIVRFAGAAGSAHIVLSRYYPGPPVSEELAAQHIVLRVPPRTVGSHWRLHVEPGPGSFLLGELVVEPEQGSIAASAEQGG